MWMVLVSPLVAGLSSSSEEAVAEDRIWLFMTSISTWNLNSTSPTFFAWRNVSLDSLFYHSYILLASSSQDKYHVDLSNLAIYSGLSFLRKYNLHENGRKYLCRIAINKNISDAVYLFRTNLLPIWMLGGKIEMNNKQKMKCTQIGNIENIFLSKYLMTNRKKVWTLQFTFFAKMLFNA